MIRKKKKFSVPEYREKKEIYEELGYKEVSYQEKGTRCYVTLENDQKDPHFYELRNYENSIWRKGPPFFPIIIFIVVAFTLLSIFVILLSISWKNSADFPLLANALSLLLPALLCMLGCVVYTYFYFDINKKILERGSPNKEEILARIKAIKNK